MPLTQLKILIVNDQKLFSKGLPTLLNNANGKLVCKVINYNDPSLKKINMYKSEIALIDLDSLDISGTEAIQLIAKKFRNAQFIMLSLYVNISLITQFKQSAERGYLEEGSKIYHFIKPLTLMTTGLGSMLKSNESIHLSTRERQLLELIADGHTNPEISTILNIQAETVKGYRKSIIKKLNVRNSAELMAKCLRDGLI